MSDDATGKTLVADTMIGRDTLGSSVTVKALIPADTPDAFRLDFRGIIEIDSFKSPEIEKEITLEPWTEDENPNVVTFYYTYKSEGSDFKYQVRHFCHTQDQETGIYTMTHEGEQLTTENHANVVTINPPAKPLTDLEPALDPDDFSLQSPETITTTLELNKVNTINIYYTEVDPIELTYKMVTLDYLDNPMSTIVGGSLDKESQSIKVSQSDNAMCFATVNKAFDVVWYYSNADKSYYDSTKPVEDQWITVTDDGKVKIHPPTFEGIYLEDATYWAVFKEQGPINIYYKAQAVNNPTDLTAVDYTFGESVSSGQDAQITHAIVESAALNGSTAQPGNKATFIA